MVITVEQAARIKSAEKAVARAVRRLETAERHPLPRVERQRQRLERMKDNYYRAVDELNSSTYRLTWLWSSDPKPEGWDEIES